MKRVALVPAMIILLTALSGCNVEHKVAGSGIRKTEKRDLPPFKAIDMQGELEVQATCQKPESFEIEGDDNILPLVQSQVRDGVLYLKAEKGYRSAKGVLIRITVPNLESVKNSGAGELRVQELKNEKFEVTSNGAPTTIASGQSKSVEIHDDGASTVDLHSLRAEKANVSSAGASEIEVYASEQLDVSVAGAGTVTYGGDPKVVNKHSMGAGTISKRESTAN